MRPASGSRIANRDEGFEPLLKLHQLPTLFKQVGLSPRCMKRLLALNAQRDSPFPVYTSRRVLATTTLTD
jgi:hypothetical protein